MADYFGIIGLLLILAGWFFELYRAIQNRKSQVPLSFAVLYGFGSLLLTWHSILLNDTVFIALNGAAALVAVANICLSFASKGKAGKKAPKK